MWFEEAVIDGVLCYRCSKFQDWTPYSAKELTTKYIEMKRRNEDIENAINNYVGRR